MRDSAARQLKSWPSGAASPVQPTLHVATSMPNGAAPSLGSSKAVPEGSVQQALHPQQEAPPLGSSSSSKTYYPEAGLCLPQGFTQGWAVHASGLCASVSMSSHLSRVAPCGVRPLCKELPVSSLNSPLAGHSPRPEPGADPRNGSTFTSGSISTSGSTFTSGSVGAAARQPSTDR